MYFNYNNYEYKTKLKLKSQQISSCIVNENPFFVKSLEDWEWMNIIDVTIEVKNQFCLIERFDYSTEINPPPPKIQIFHASWYVRYPVILKKFHLNPGTGGHGQHKGGDGIIREYLFRKDLTLSILTERRVFSPYGLNGTFSLCLWF